MRNRIKGIFAALIAVACLFGIGNLYAEDFKTPHTFNPGDVISSDVLNEVFEEIKRTKKSVQSSDILGNWVCRQTTLSGKDPGGNDANLAGATTDADSLVQTRSGTVTFIDDGDGTFSWSQSTHNFFQHANDNEGPVNGTYIVVDNIVVFNYAGSCCGKTSFYITAISPTRYKMIFINNSAGGVFNYIICDKQNLPPTAPTKLSASTSGLSVILSWTDNSSDETGFKIIRKDTLDGNWTTIATTSADTTTYTDSGLSAGKHWYRVKTTNANGESLGSNVVKVDVSE